MAQSANYLLCKHKDVSLDPLRPRRSQIYLVVYTCRPRVERKGQSHPKQTNELQVEWKIWPQKTKWRPTKEEI